MNKETIDMLFWWTGFLVWIAWFGVLIFYLIANYNTNKLHRKYKQSLVMDCGCFRKCSCVVSVVADNQTV